MTVDDLIRFYNLKNDAHLSRRLGVTRGAISNWRRKGITEEYQAVYQVMTNNALKADLPSYKHLMQAGKC